MPRIPGWRRRRRRRWRVRGWQRSSASRTAGCAPAELSLANERSGAVGSSMRPVFQTAPGAGRRPPSRDVSPIILVMSTSGRTLDISSGTCQDAVSFPSPLVSGVEGETPDLDKRSSAVRSRLNLPLRFGSTSRQTDTTDDAGRNLVQLIAPPLHQTHGESPPPSYRRARRERRRAGGHVRQLRSRSDLRRARRVARQAAPAISVGLRQGQSGPEVKALQNRTRRCRHLARRRSRRRVRPRYREPRWRASRAPAACRRPARSMPRRSRPSRRLPRRPRPPAPESWRSGRREMRSRHSSSH